MMSQARANVAKAWTKKALAAGALIAALLMGGLVALPAHASSTTFTVNSTADLSDLDTTDDVCDTDAAAGRRCTLRAAIEQANATSGADIINFHISGTGIKNITPTALHGELPPITEQLTINGYSQRGASPNTLAKGTNAKLKVELDGTSAGDFVDGLTIEAPNLWLRGL